MSRLYGSVAGRAYTEATRCGDDSIITDAQSWDFRIRVHMLDDQTAIVTARDLITHQDKVLFSGSLEDFFGRKAPKRDRYGQEKPIKVKQTKPPKLTKAQQRALQLQQQMIATLFGGDDEAAEVVAS